MKIITINTLAIIAFMALSLTACSVNEKNVSVSNVELTGPLKEFAKVVNSKYKFTNDGNDAFITIQFELVKKPTQELCRKKIPESVRLNAIESNGSIFDTGVYGFVANQTEMSKLKELLNKGNIGDKKSVSFMWNYYGVSKDIGEKIFKNATSFEIIDDTFNNCSELSVDDLHWDDTKSASSDKEVENSTLSGSENWDNVLDEYDKYVDEYVSFYKKAMKGDEDAMSEYPALMEKAISFQTSLENAKNDKSLSVKQSARMMKIQMKMMKGIQNQ